MTKRLLISSVTSTPHPLNMKVGQEYFKAKDAYEAKSKVCVMAKGALENKTGECDVFKMKLDTESCASKGHHKELQYVFDETWKVAQVNLANKC